MPRMGGALSILAGYFGGWFWTLLALVETLSFAYFYACLRGKDSRLGVVRWLKSRRATPLYERWVGGALDWLDRSLTPDDAETNPPPERGWVGRFRWSMQHPQAPDRVSARIEGRRAFGWTLFDIALRLAIAYPILFLLGTWAITGKDGKVGGLPVLSATDNWGVRGVAIGGIAAVLGLIVFSYSARALGRLGWANVAQGLAVVVVVAVAFAGAFAGAGAVAGAVAVAGAGAFAFAGAGAIAVAGAVAVAVMGAGAGTLAGAFAVAGTFAVVVAFAVVGAFAFAFTGAFAFAVASTLLAAIRRGRDGRVTYVLFACALLSILVLAAGLLPEEEDEPRVWLVFLGLLPLANGCFDYLSFGVTRWLIRKGVAWRDWRTVLLGAADLGMALILFTGLGLFLVAVLTAMNAVSAAPVLDLQRTLLDIRDNPHEYWWLYVSFFSTLLPTLAHFAISTACLVWLIPRGWRRCVRKMLTEKARGDLRHFWAPVILSMMGTFAVVAPIVLCVVAFAGIAAAAPDIGTWYLSLFLEFAEFLGAPVEPEAIWT